MSGIKFANFSRRRPKVSDRNVGKLQSREDVVAPRACGRSLGQSLLMIAATTAFSAQVRSKNRPKISHHHLHCRTKNKTSDPFCLSGRKDRFGSDCPKVAARTKVPRPTIGSSPVRADVAAHPWPPNPGGRDRFSRYHHREPTIVVGQRLAYGIALIVVPAPWEREELRLEICEP
jgi:hypothetical protein